MGYYEELDQEIDEEMGWADKKTAGRRGIVTAGDVVQHMLNKIRLPRVVTQAFKALFRVFRKTLLYPLVSPLSYSKSFNVEGDIMLVKRSWKWRILDGFLTRLMLTPVIIGIFLIAVVYSSTHPQRVHATITPESVGVYFKRVTLVTLDGQALTAWYIPPVTATEMSFNPVASLTQKRPAAVVCHGLGASQDQYIALAHELHRAGFAVLLVDMRGQGESESAAVTYGLRERFDVLAGVKYLRELPNIDGGKICVAGHDIGAIAALQAATMDSSVAAVVADGMWPKFEDRARNIFMRPGRDSASLPTGWLAPLYTIAFEVAIRDRLSQMDPEAVVRNIHSQPVLFIARHGPNYAPVQDVMALATTVGSHHEVLVPNESTTPGSVEVKVRDFLVQAMHWKDPKTRGVETIEKLLDNRVK